MASIVSSLQSNALEQSVLAQLEVSEFTLLALQRARESEARWMKGQPCGALDGVPVTIKDNIATQGDPTPPGTAATALVPAAQDAPPAARLHKAGAI